MIRKLEAAFAGWHSRESRCPLRPDDHPPPLRIYAWRRRQQGRVSIAAAHGEASTTGRLPLEVMNEILGGSGFTARITKTVRSDEARLTPAVRASPASGTPALRASSVKESRSVPTPPPRLGRFASREGAEPRERRSLRDDQKSPRQTLPRRVFARAKDAVDGIFASDEYTEARSLLLGDLPEATASGLTAADVQTGGPGAPRAGEDDRPRDVGSKPRSTSGREHHVDASASLSGGKDTTLPAPTDDMSTRESVGDLGVWGGAHPYLSERLARKSFQHIGLLLFTTAVRKSTGPSWCSPFQTRGRARGPSKKQSASSFVPL